MAPSTRLSKRQTLAAATPQDTKAVFLPGSVIGILGSGQLGRMLTLAARQLGYRIAVYSPDKETPAGAVADREWTAPYDDLEQIHAFARSVDVVTFEFENVPSLTTAAAAEHALVRPGGDVLHLTQHRLREKSFLKDNGFPVTEFRAIGSRSELQSAVTDPGRPGVLKTASFGYDGKGQIKVTPSSDLDAVWLELGGQQGIYEAFVDFEKEVSVVAARTIRGEVRCFPVFENRHSNHILDLTFAPAAIPEVLGREAQDLAASILERLHVVGLLTVEMFVTRRGRLVVNELAPRTHNSGHLTLDACVTSQFEQQVRAVCGLPLGDPKLRSPAAMANLLGHLWMGGEPDWAGALDDDPGAKLHLYGKKEARIGRKMGHLTVCAESAEEALKRVIGARNRLVQR